MHLNYIKYYKDTCGYRWNENFFFRISGKRSSKNYLSILFSKIFIYTFCGINRFIYQEPIRNVFRNKLEILKRRLKLTVNF
jgi:hypothetical protein